MKVEYVGCPSCNGDVCLGAEYRGHDDMTCHCPHCASEFPFGEAIGRPIRWSLTANVAQ